MEASGFPNPYHTSVSSLAHVHGVKSPQRHSIKSPSAHLQNRLLSQTMSPTSHQKDFRSRGILLSPDGLISKDQRDNLLSPTYSSSSSYPQTPQFQSSPGDSGGFDTPGMIGQSPVFTPGSDTSRGFVVCTLHQQAENKHYLLSSEDLYVCTRGLNIRTRYVKTSKKKATIRKHISLITYRNSQVLSVDNNGQEIVTYQKKKVNAFKKLHSCKHRNKHKKYQAIHPKKYFTHPKSMSQQICRRFGCYGNVVNKTSFHFAASTLCLAHMYQCLKVSKCRRIINRSYHIIEWLKQRRKNKKLSASTKKSEVKSPTHVDAKEVSRSPIRDIDHLSVKGHNHYPIMGLNHSPIKGLNHSPNKEVIQSPVIELSHSPIVGLNHSPIKAQSRRDSSVMVITPVDTPDKTFQQHIIVDNNNSDFFKTILKIQEANLAKNKSDNSSVDNNESIILAKSPIKESCSIVSPSNSDVSYVSTPIVNEKIRRNSPIGPQIIQHSPDIVDGSELTLSPKVEVIVDDQQIGLSSSDTFGESKTNPESFCFYRCFQCPFSCDLKNKYVTHIFRCHRLISCNLCSQSETPNDQSSSVITDTKHNDNTCSQLSSKEGTSKLAYFRFVSTFEAHLLEHHQSNNLDEAACLNVYSGKLQR